MWEAIVGGASMLANMFGQAQANKTNRQIARETNRANMDMFHQNLAYNDPSSQKARLKAAGLNSDLMYGNGASGLVNSNVPQMQNGAPMENVAGSLDPVAAANIALTLSQKKAQDIENDRNENEDFVFSGLEHHEIHDPVTGHVIDPEDVEQWTKDHPGQLPETQVLKVKNKGGAQALMKRIEFLAQAKEYRLREVSADIQRQLSKEQWLDPEVRKAMVQMPSMEFMKGMKQIAVWAQDIKESKQRVNTSKAQEGLFASQEELNRLEKDLQENAPSWAALVTMLKDDKASFSDKFLSVLGYALEKMAARKR